MKAAFLSYPTTVVALLVVERLSAAEPAPSRLEVASAVERDDLNQLFHQTDGWTGGDVAYTIPLSSDRTLWVFADSFIGRVEKGRREGARMVNNTFAWQSLAKADAPLQFFWRTTDKASASVLVPKEPATWYWPGDGVMVDDRLYLLAKHVGKNDQGEPGFQFDWLGEHLLRIDQPLREPTDWQFESIALPSGSGDLRLSGACLLEGDYLYVYGLFPARLCGGLNQPLGIARIHREQLAKFDGRGWEFWCRGAKEKGPDGWSAACVDPVTLFRDGAPELTVSRVRGIPGFVATYTALGMGPSIMVRHALRPEGPWSESVRVYRCPESELKTFMYGAKAHPDLAQRDRQLVITYCSNIGSLSDHVKHPDIYLPRAIEVMLKVEPTPQK